MSDPNGNESAQSEAMGRSDDDEEEQIPMKQPAINNGGEKNDNEADESFLDDDFLSFSNVDNGGASANGKNGDQLSGRKREREPSPMPRRSDGRNNNYNHIAQNEGPIVPWLDNTTNPQKPPPPPPPPQQQQQQWGRDRGYGGGNENQYNYIPPPPRTPPLIRLHNEIVSFVNLMKPTAEEMKLRERMVERVTDLAHKVFGGKDKCQVLPFGSQVTGLCLPGSDIDFVIRFPEAKMEEDAKEGKKAEGDGDEDYATTSNPLRRFAEAVKNEFGIRSELETDGATAEEVDDDGEHLSYLEVIEHTRVPLVKFTVAPYNIDVDVCFDQPCGPEAAELMHRFMESMPPLRPLTFILKYFLASRDINKPFTGGIGSYMLQLMIVSYLQHRAREDNSRDCLGDGKHFNLGSLLLDFLELYGLDFNYVTTGISVRHDGYYFPKGQKEMRDVFYQPSRPFSLAMENPLDPKMDVGGGAFRMQMIQRVFAHAFKTLLAYVSEPMTPTDSILARIIPPTEEMEKRMVLKRDMKVDEEAEEDDEFASNGNSAKQGKKDRKSSDKKARKKDQRKTEKKWQPPKQRRHSGGGVSGNNKEKKQKRKEKRYSK